MCLSRLPLKPVGWIENKLVGYLPREISRAAKVLLGKVANVTHLFWTHYISFIPRKLRDALNRKGLLSCQHQSWYVDGKVQRINWKFIYPTKEWSYCRLFHRKDGPANEVKKKDVSNKLEQREASSKDKTKDIRTFFKIAEKRENGENKQVQENMPVDIIDIY